MSTSGMDEAYQSHTCDFFMFCPLPMWVLWTDRHLLAVLGALKSNHPFLFSCPYRHWSCFAFHCFPSQVSIFHNLMWFPVHSIPPFLLQAFFPYTNIPSVSVLLFSHQDVSYLFSCTYHFGSPWPAMLSVLFSSFPWKLQFLIVPESYPLPCGSGTF